MGKAAEVCFRALDDIFRPVSWSPPSDLGRGTSTHRARDENTAVNRCLHPNFPLLLQAGSVPERLSQTQQSVSFPPAWQQRAHRFSTACRAESRWQVRHWWGLGPLQCLHELSHGSQVSYRGSISQMMILGQQKWKGVEIRTVRNGAF